MQNSVYVREMIDAVLHIPDNAGINIDMAAKRRKKHKN